MDLSLLAEPESEWLKQIASTCPDEAAVELPVGAVLHAGRYLVQHEVGRGGMGIVYAAWDHERRETVALKTLKRRSPTSIYRIKQEFRGLGHLVHPNLVRLHELFEDSGRWCFTLELVPGQTLLRALRGASVTAILGALRQLAAGISALHAAGKLHRDLKPSNVMLTPSGRVVILDFGLSEDIELAAEVGSTAALGPIGTPGYMAPELYAPGAASQASDWYAFGAIFWQLLTGRLPFEGAPWRARAEAPATLRLEAEGVPPELTRLCRALLAPDPGARPRAHEIICALGTGAGSMGPQASLAPLGGLAPPGAFLGRAHELGRLREAYAACRVGPRPVVLLLAGEPGIGKTALVRSFLNELEGSLVLNGRCYEREFVPYKAFDAAVDELCRYLEQLPAAERAELLPEDFAALCTLFPVLGRVHPQSSLAAAQAGDAHELRRRGFEALGELLGGIRRSCPVVLWIDDLQWTDADSTGLLLHLLRQAGAPQILLIASHRSDPERSDPERSDPEAQHGHLRTLYEALASDLRLDVRTLELGPLSEGDATALLNSVSPGAPRAVVERAQGHPFLLEELSRYAARRAPGVVVWPSLEQAIGARVNALASGERRLLELLAVAGRPLSERIAQQAMGRGGHSALQVLCGSRLARRNAADGSLCCYHDVIREAVLGAVSAPRARQCHRALALGMLRGSDVQPEHLALHLACSGHSQRAAEQMVVAARRADASLAFERAAQLYQSALELGRFDASAASRLELARAHALSAAGRGNEAAELYLRGVEGGDAEQAFELRTRAAEQYLLSGHLEQGLELLRSALQPVGIRLHTTAPATIASFAYNRARLRLRGYRFAPRPVPAGAARRLLILQRVSVALARIDPLRACELASRALVLALEVGSAEAIGTALVSDVLVGALFRVSDAELGRRIERAEAACARFGSAQEGALLHSTLATAARLKAQPDLPTALGHLERFFELHREHVLPRASYERPWAEWARAVVRCLGGELARVAREVPARLDEGWARGDNCIIPLWAGGDQLLARLAVGDVAAAERDLARAQRLWSSRSFTLQDLMLALGAFHLQRYQGDRRGAWQTAETALARLRASPLRRMPNALDTVQGLRGHAALELAQVSLASERRDLLQLARRVQRAPPRHPNLAAMVRCHLLAAACHFQTGNAERAALALSQAEPHLQSIPLYAHAVRYRRGLLVGGEQGASLASEARAFLVARGAVDPERLLDLLLPGYARAPSG